MLGEFVDRYGKGGWRGLQVPGIQIHRFASADLATTIQQHWALGIENPEVREVLLNVIEAGKVKDCADIAYQAATDREASHRERIDALGALAALGDGRVDAIVKSLAVDSARWPNQIARWAAIRLFPDNMGVDELCRVLARISEKPDSIDGVGWTLSKLLEGAALPEEALEELRDRLTALISEGLHWREEWPHLVSKRQFLVSALATICARQFRKNAVTVDLLHSSVVALRLSHEGDGHDKPSKDLRQAVASLQARDRSAAFWADESLMQGLHPELDSQKRFYRSAFYGPLDLTIERDADWVSAMLTDRMIPTDKRAVILEGAIRLWDRTSDWKKYLTSLKSMVSDLPQLVTVLDTLPQEVKPDPEMQRMEAESAKRKREAHRRDKAAHASWVKFWREVAEHPDAVFADNRAANTALNLWRAMERTGEESRGSGWNRLFIERHFGKATADRLRKTLMKIWRNDRPTLRSERNEQDKNTTLVRWQLGLAAITAEAEDSAWADWLSSNEALLAARYAPATAQWLPSLARRLGRTAAVERRNRPRKPTRT